MKQRRFEKIVEWDFRTINEILQWSFEIREPWHLITFPFWSIAFLAGFIITFPIYFIHHLFFNRKVYYKEIKK